MIRRLILALVFLSAPAIVHAQSNVCDTTTPTSGTDVAGTSMTVSHCFSGKDTTGTINLTPTSFKLYIDGVAQTITMTAGSTSTVSGKTVYTGTATAPAAGTHQLQTTVLVGTVESAKGNTFTLTTTAPVPSAPTNLTAQ